MSTVDAQLIQSSSIFVKDLYLASKPEAAKNENELAVFHQSSRLFYLPC